MNPRTADTAHKPHPDTAATVNVSNVDPQHQREYQRDNAEHDLQSPILATSHHAAPQQTPSSLSDHPQRNTPLPSTTPHTIMNSFDEMLQEVLSEQPIFNPESSTEQQSDWSSDTPPTQDLNTQEPILQTDDFFESAEQPHHPQRIDSETGQSTIRQVIETTSKARASLDADEAMTPSENPLSTATAPTDEDPQAFGALSIPLIDQYPCFAASPDGNRIEIDDSSLQHLRGQTDASIDCNLVTVGSYHSLDDILGLKKEYFPLLSLESTLQKPFSSSIVDPLCPTGDNKENQQQNDIVKEHLPAEPLAKGVCSDIQPPKDYPVTSKHESKDMCDDIFSRPAGNCSDQPAMFLPPALINMQPQVLDQLTLLENPASSNQENLRDSRGTPLSTVENTSVTQPELQTISPSPWANTSPHTAFSLSEVTSEKHSNQIQASGIQQNASLRHCSELPTSIVESQPKLLRKASHASLYLRASPSNAKFRSSNRPSYMNVSIPKQPQFHVSGSGNVKGKQRISPTSIMSEEMPFQFQDKPQHMAKPGLTAGVQNVPLGAQTTKMNGHMASGEKTAGDKRGICDVGSSYETPTKKSRVVDFNHVDQRHGKRGDDLSQTSRIAHKQAPLFQSPVLPGFSNHFITQNQSALSHAQVPNFGIGRQVPQWIQPALYANTQLNVSNLGGQKSEATVSSPSKPRPTDVRDESGHLPKRYVCSDCSEAFAFKENCERHYKVIHQGRTVYYCHHCRASYLQSKTMRLHVEKKHHKMDEKNSVFPCYWCGFKTNTISDWNKHVSETHPGHKNKFRGGAV